jgi:hypothetical protein
MSVLLLIGFMSVSMFATLTVPAPPQIAFDEEDPSQPVVGHVVADCRVMIQERGRLTCVDSVEYREDNSGAVALSTERR